MFLVIFSSSYSRRIILKKFRNDSGSLELFLSNNHEISWIRTFFLQKIRQKKRENRLARIWGVPLDAEGPEKGVPKMTPN